MASAISRSRSLALIALHRLASGHAAGPPVAVVGHRFHELVRDAHGIVGVLEEDGAVGFAIERRIVAGVDQRVRLLLFLGLAPDETLDVRMIGVEDHHLRRAPRLAAGLDHARERIEALHEAQRTGGTAAAGQPGVLLAQRRKVGARARSPLEQHAFGLRQVENRFERILHRIDEAGRALRARLALLQLHNLVVVSS